MNIKQAEQLSGVSRQNIRFYEREGLLHPSRNPENDYREYHQKDIHTLKLIRAMRMLNMPLDQIHGLLRGDISLPAAAETQQIQLREQMQKLTSAIHFCDELKKRQSLDDLDVDEILHRMETPEIQKSLFQVWLEDYKKIRLSEQEKVFTFIPEDAVTNAREFSDALFAYANAHNLDLVISKEGMYPEFTIDGIEYTAERFYTHFRGIPVATVRCTVKHPEDFEPDIPEGRKKYMKLLNLSRLLIPGGILTFILALNLAWRGLLSSWEGWVLLLSLMALALVNLYRYVLFHFNENGK